MRSGRLLLAVATLGLFGTCLCEFETEAVTSLDADASATAVGFDEFNFNAESEGWVDMGNAGDMGESGAHKLLHSGLKGKLLGNSLRESTLDSTENVTEPVTECPSTCDTCYFQNSKICKTNQNTFLKCSKKNGIWCGVAPTPSPTLESNSCPADCASCYHPNRDPSQTDPRHICKTNENTFSKCNNNNGIWCGVAPTPMPTPAPTPCAFPTGSTETWIKNIACFASELQDRSRAKMTSAAGVKHCVDSVHYADIECQRIGWDKCNQHHLKEATDGLIGKACNTWNSTVPPCCADKSCDASVCWTGMDTVDDDGNIVPVKVKKGMRDNYIALKLDEAGDGTLVNYIAKVSLDMSTKKVSFCLKSTENRCFTQKTCGEMTIVVSKLQTMVPYPSVSNPGRQKYTTVTVPTEGDALHTPLQAALTEKNKELVRMLCNAA